MNAITFIVGIICGFIAAMALMLSALFIVKQEKNNQNKD